MLCCSNCTVGSRVVRSGVRRRPADRGTSAGANSIGRLVRGRDRRRASERPRTPVHGSGSTHQCASGRPSGCDARQCGVGCSHADPGGSGAHPRHRRARPERPQRAGPNGTDWCGPSRPRPPRRGPLRRGPELRGRFAASRLVPIGSGMESAQQLSPRVDSDLPVHGLQMIAHGVGAQPELGGDRVDGLPP